MEHICEPGQVIEYTVYCPIMKLDACGTPQIVYEPLTVREQLYNFIMRPKNKTEPTTIPAGITIGPRKTTGLIHPPLDEKQRGKDPIDRICGPGPMERITTTKDPLDRLTLEDLMHY